MTKVFASLSPQEALQVAIYIEERNAGVYQRFAEMFTEFRDPESLEIASVFWDMSVEEKRHSSVLQNRYAERFGAAQSPITEEDVHELIEVPRLETSDVFEAMETTTKNPRQRALHVALQAENSAQNFYARLVGQTEDAAMRQLYTELATMEDGHVTYLQGLLAAAATEPQGVH
jgi:rubrerythrin